MKCASNVIENLGTVELGEDTISIVGTPCDVSDKRQHIFLFPQANRDLRLGRQSDMSSPSYSTSPHQTPPMLQHYTAATMRRRPHSHQNHNVGYVLL